MKEDILEGLKNALAKGESLQQAMQSFHNAGYEMKDIEEAARELQSKMPQYYPKPLKIQKKQEIPNKKEFSTKPPVQIVSNYEKKQTNPRKIILIVIVSLIIVLIIFLGGILLFKERLLEFFSSLFG